MRQDSLRLRAASKTLLPAIGTIILHVHIGKLCVRVCFGIVDNSAVALHLGTSFVDYFIRAIFLWNRESVPWHSASVATIRSHNASVSSLEKANGHAESYSHISVPFTVCKMVLIASFTEQVAQVSTSIDSSLSITPISV